MTDTETTGAVRATVHDASEQVHGVAEAGMEEVAKVASEVKAQTGKLVGDASTKIRERADTQIGAAASMLSSVSGELERMASSTSPGSSLASLVHDGATMTRKLSERLDRNGLDGAMQDVRMFARRRPVMFLAGAFAVGMAGGRLMRNVDVRSIAPSNSEHERAGNSNGSTDAWSGSGSAYAAESRATESSVPMSTEPTADIEADWNAPGGATITGEPA